MFKPLIAAILTGCLVAFYFLELRQAPAAENLELPGCPHIRMNNMRHDEAAKLFNACPRNYVHITFVGRAASDIVPLGGFEGNQADSFIDALAGIHCDYVMTRRGHEVTIAVDPNARCTKRS